MHRRVDDPDGKYYVPLLEDKLTADKLTKKQLDFIRRLNDSLITLESNIKTEAKRLVELGKKRVTDKDDWVNDYEIACVISYYLNEYDPDYKEDSDNILYQMETTFKRRVDKCLFDEGTNWNELRNREGHPFQHEHHCYLLHDLIDHSDIGWDNILRIGKLWLDIKIEFQMFENIG